MTERTATGPVSVPAVTAVLVAAGTGAGYVEDLAALRARTLPEVERFRAAPVTPGFRAVREVAEAVSVGLAFGLSDSAHDGTGVAWGDCLAVSYGGKAGRETVFRSDAGEQAIHSVIAPALMGQPLGSFRDLAARIDALVAVTEGVRPKAGRRPGVDMSRREILSVPARALRAAQGGDAEKVERYAERCRLHSAIRFGVSQALLQAVASVRQQTMAEVISQEWGLPVPNQPIPLHAQSGAERHANAEKMIVRRLASLPHALVDDIPAQLGTDGGEMTRYIRWLGGRIRELGGEGYSPTIHLDLHGALGTICHNQPGRMLGHLYAWEAAAQPFPLRIESPLILDSCEAQIDAMCVLRDYVRRRELSVQLVADEWANTVEEIQAFVRARAADMIQIKLPDLGSLHNAVDAVLACKTGGVGAFVGGSYAETEISARASVHVALATQADLLMAKPGMGVDEAVSLARNEMARTLAEIGWRTSARSAGPR